MTPDASVVAVVVTWNRHDLLLEVLSALRSQTVPVSRVVVVDNASTDGTAETLRAQGEDVVTVTARTNTGGAGGFAIGIRRALELGCDAVWLMDDDTVPEPEALAALVRARGEFPLGTPTVVASR